MLGWIPASPNFATMAPKKRGRTAAAAASSSSSSQPAGAAPKLTLRGGVPHHPSLVAFWRDERLTDFAICAEGVEFKAHRVALASSSKYFLNLFESGMRDAADATHALEGIPAKALEALLAFIYEGKCEFDEGLLTEGAPGEQDQKLGCWDQRWGGRAERIKGGKFRVGGSVGFRPGPPRSSRRGPGARGSTSSCAGFTGSTFLKSGSQDQAAENPLKCRNRACQKGAAAEKAASQDQLARKPGSAAAPRSLCSLRLREQRLSHGI